MGGLARRRARVLASLCLFLATTPLGWSAPSADILMLSQDWQPSSCKGGIDCRADKQPFGVFSMSGLSAVSINETDPKNCAGPAWNASAIPQDIRAELDCIWQNNKGKNENLWQQVWTRVGTCTGLSIPDYFTFVTQQYNARNANVALARAGVPAGLADRAAILDALQAAWGVKAWATCSAGPDTATGARALTDVQLCFNSTSLALIDCPWDPSDPRVTAGGPDCAGTLLLSPGVTPTPQCEKYFPATLEGAIRVPPPPPPPPAPPGGGGTSSSTAAIVGGVLGGVAAAALLTGALLWWRRRRAAAAAASAAGGATGPKGAGKPGDQWGPTDADPKGLSDLESGGAGGKWAPGSPGSPTIGAVAVRGLPPGSPASLAPAGGGALDAFTPASPPLSPPASTYLGSGSTTAAGAAPGLAPVTPNVGTAAELELAAAAEVAGVARARSSPSSSAGGPPSLPVSSKDPLYSYLLASHTQGKQQPPGGAAAPPRRAAGGAASHASHARQASLNVRAWAIPFSDLAISRSIGEGSFGRVYEAEWHATPVAVKLLLGGEQIGAEALLAQMQAEADLMLNLRHPCCVQIMGIVEEPPCLVTEFCSRGSLTDVLARARRGEPGAAAALTWRRRLVIALDAAKGMLHLHSRSLPIVHRDLKSPNLLVDEAWRGKVSDFNLSKLLEDDPSKSSSMAAMNPRWLAPEVMQGERATQPADVFAFGVVLWELLTWELPWGSANPWFVVSTVLNGGRLELPAADAALPGPGRLPPPLLASYLELLQACWAQDAAARPTFKEVADRLRRLLDALVESVAAAAAARRAAGGGAQPRPAPSAEPAPP